MGTSTAGSELPSDKLAKLQARRKELEVLLAAKNEDLYKLCVQEVKLTGIMPPEVPNSGPESPKEVVLSPAVEKFHASSSSDRRDLEGTYRKDVADSGPSRKPRQAYRHSADKIKDSDSRKQVTHRLSTPSISGVSAKSNYSRKGEFASANYVSLAHDNHDSFSLHSSQTYPTLAPERTASVREQRRPHVSADTLPASYSRHHTVTTQQLSRLYYNSERPETQTFTKMHETHFSSSHPDISTHCIHTTSSIQPAPPIQPTTGTPLLYQYASQLKARSHHLSAMQVAPPMPARNKSERRNTLQRTLTYHLTSPSDYPGHFDNTVTPAQHPPHVHRHLPPTGLQIQADLDPQPLPMRRHHSEQSPVHSVHAFQYSPVPLSPQSISSSRQLGLNHSSNPSLYGSQYVDSLDQKGKEKEWYESSLDSPSEGNMGMNLSRESMHMVQPPQPVEIIQPPQVQPVPVVHQSPKRPVQRTPSMPQPHTSQVDASVMPASEHPLPNASHIPAQSPMTPPSQQNPPGVQFESPKNCTVVESGKWIPYREVTKPFEMSDFYKYSTKFRQSNPSQKPRLAPPLPNPSNYNSQPDEAHGFNNPEQWRHAHQL